MREPKPEDVGANAWEPHRHRCSKCATVWFHDPVDTMDAAMKVVEETGKDELGNELLRKSHECPDCGHAEHWTYGGDKPAECIHNGIVTQPITEIPKTEETTERLMKRFMLMLDVKQHSAAR